MGLFDHLFKSKSPPSEENSVETGSNLPEPAKHSESAARSAPQRADPSAFLHPKSFVPRGMTPLAPPKPGAASSIVSPSRKPGAPQPAAPAVEEIVLTLGDVLSRIPTPYLKLGQHDPKRELRFSINDLSSDIARGRAAVPLSRIARLVPDIFVKEIGPDEDSEVRLPLQKLVEQIGMLRARPPQPADKTARTTTTSTSASTQPAGALKVHFPEVETAAPGEETLRGMFASVEPVFELKPMEGVVLDLPIGQEPAFVLKPVAERTDWPFSVAPEAPLTSAPVDVAAEKSVVPERQTAETAVAAVKEAAGAPETPEKWEGSAFESLLERAERISQEPPPKSEETVATKPTEVPAAISVAPPAVPGDLPAVGEPKLPAPEQGTAEGIRPSSETVSGTFEPLLPKREPVASNAEPVQPGSEAIPAVTEPIRTAKEIVIMVAPATLPASKPANSVAFVERPSEVSGIASPLSSQPPLEPAPPSVMPVSAPAESLQTISAPNILPIESGAPAITPDQTSVEPLSTMAPPDSTPGSTEIPRISFNITPAESPTMDVAVVPLPVESAVAPVPTIQSMPSRIDALAPSMEDKSAIPRASVEPSTLPPLESVAAIESDRLLVESGPVATAPTAESAPLVPMALAPPQLPDEPEAGAAFLAPLEPAANGLQSPQPPIEVAASPLAPPPIPGESAAPIAVPTQSVVQETAAPGPASDHPPLEPVAVTVAPGLPVGTIAPWGAVPETSRVESSTPVPESVESAGKPEDVSIEPSENAAATGEVIVPSAQITAPEIPQTQKLAIRETPSGAEVGEEKIQLSLAAILRQCPREIIVGELPVVPDSVRITLPFAPIDRQLVMGHVEISAVRFIAAIPFTYQKFFTARMGVKVPIPLEEVFQNLPNPAKEVPVASGPPPLILAPAVPEDLPISEDEPGFTETTVPPIQTQTLHIAHQPDVAPPPVESAPAAVVSPLEVIPASLIPTGENAPVDTVPPMESSSSIPEPKMEKIEKAEGGGEKLPAPEATVEPHALLETVTPVTPSAEAESVPPTAPVALDLPAFHQFTPPPPSIAPEHASDEAVHAAASELAPEPVSPSDVGPELAETEIPKMVGGDVPTPVAPSGHELPAARISGTKPESEAPASPAVEAAAPAAVTPIEKLPETSILSEEPMTQPTASTETKSDEGSATGEATKPTEEASALWDEPTAPAPPVEPPSLSVAGEDGNQTFRLPQIIRPFIVLPPPILGFAPTPSAPESVADQVTQEKEVASDITQEDEAAFIAIAGIDILPKQDVAPEGSSTVEPVEVVEPEVEALHRPGHINIDFAEALAPSGEAPVADLSTQGLSLEIPSAVPSADLPPPVESIPSHEQEVPAHQGEAKPAEAPSGGITFAATGQFTELPTPEPALEPMVAPAAELPPAAAMIVPPAEPVPQPTATESGPILDAALEPSSTAEMPPVAEAMPEPVVAPEAPVPPSIVFESTEEPAPEKLAASLSVPEEGGDEATEGEPLLHLPKIIEQFSATEVLPPALPLRRFDQDALQALFMTEDTLDLPKISRLAAQLPGVHACVIATRDQACTGGTLPEGFDLAALLGLAPRVGEAAGRMPIGDLKHFTLYGERYSVSFFARNGLSLCAVHRPRSFVPGVREKLVAIADELSK